MDLLVDTATRLVPSTALDLACGSGRNAIWLADHGWQVTAVDREPIFTHPSVDIRTADLEKHEYTIEPESWGLIVITYYLQRDLFEPAKRGLKHDGVIIAVALLSEEPMRFRVQPGELRRYFEGWQILHDYEGSVGNHHRQVAEIVARIP